jgi:hypothetical protein
MIKSARPDVYDSNDRVWCVRRLRRIERVAARVSARRRERRGGRGHAHPRGGRVRARRRAPFLLPLHAQHLAGPPAPAAAGASPLSTVHLRQ